MRGLSVGYLKTSQSLEGTPRSPISIYFKQYMYYFNRREVRMSVT